MVAVRQKKTAPAKGTQAKQVPAQPFAFPAPVKGLVLNESRMVATPGSARVLDNWICRTDSIRCRGGYLKYATIAPSAPVVSMFTYRAGGTEKLFAASAASVYDITTVADAGVIPTAAFTGQTSGYYSSANFGTTSGNYLYICNGDDSPMLFDGSTWTAITGASSPAITGVTTSGLSQVWVYASRLWFVEGSSMTAWYLPVDSIGGAALSVSLAGVFKKGGSLMFGASWSLDAGDGLDDKCVFVSTEGEVAIYAGIDPSSASTWALQGVYEISPPLGINAIMRAGGDLLIATTVGLVPLSEAIKRDVAALSLGAVSRRIEPYWQDQANDYLSDALPWEIERWAVEGVMVVTQPKASMSLGTMLVANLQTGAWSRFTNMDARCLGVLNDYIYYGSSDGLVYRLQETGSDNGTPYTCVYIGQHEQMGFMGEKTLAQMRPLFSSNIPIQPQVSALVNYSETRSSAPNSHVSTETDGWDISVWDTSLWDASATGGTEASESQWTAIGRTGHAIAPEVQVTLGVTTLPVVDLVGLEAMFMPGTEVA